VREQQGLVVLYKSWVPAGKPEKVHWIAASLFSIALLLLPWLIKLDGKPHADWQQFLGRFHPLAVHLPIGLLVLAPLLELAGISRPALREAAGFVLNLAFLVSLGALSLGYLLAYGSGETGTLVTHHMWGGIALTIGVLLSMLARLSWSSGTLVRLYPIVLTCTLITLLWTAHEGGSITHGSNYLTQYMPAGIRQITLASATRASNSSSFYGKHIDPIFDAKCVSCHGESKISGGLRLDSYEQLMHGGKNGSPIIPGNPDKSLLLYRVTLPASHKEFMPAEGRPPLTPEEIGLIRAWIKQGASSTDLSLAGVTIPDAQIEAPTPSVGDYSKLMPEIEQMEKSQGAKLMPVSSKPSDGLVLYTVDAASSFGDSQLLQFEKYAPYIVEVELGRTAVTDASFDTLAKFTHLRAIHLEGTRITGQDITKLTSLSQLTYLNLSGTELTRAAAATLPSLKGLRHVYLYNTPAQPTQSDNSVQPDEQRTQ